MSTLEIILTIALILAIGDKILMHFRTKKLLKEYEKLRAWADAPIMYSKAPAETGH